MYILLRIFLSSNSSKVGLKDNLRMSFAPIIERSVLRSSSDIACKIFLSMSSCLPGRWDSFKANESFRVRLTVRRSANVMVNYDTDAGCSRYRLHTVRFVIFPFGYGRKTGASNSVWGRSHCNWRHFAWATVFLILLVGKQPHWFRRHTR